MVEESGQRVGLRLQLELRARARVVERERDRVAEALCELELVVREGGRLAEAVDVQRALHAPARDERDAHERLGLVRGGAGHRLAARVEVRLVCQHRPAIQRRPARDPLAVGDPRAEDLLGPAVACVDGDELARRLLRLVDGQRVVRDELGQRGRDLLEQRVQLLLGEELVEDVGEALVRLDPARARGRGRDGPNQTQLPHGRGHAAPETSRCAACYDIPESGVEVRPPRWALLDGAIVSAGQGRGLTRPWCLAPRRFRRGSGASRRASRASRVQSRDRARRGSAARRAAARRRRGDAPPAPGRRKTGP